MSFLRLFLLSSLISALLCPQELLPQVDVQFTESIHVERRLLPTFRVIGKSGYINRLTKSHFRVLSQGKSVDFHFRSAQEIPRIDPDFLGLGDLAVPQAL